MFKELAAIFSLFLLASCSSNLNELKTATPKGSTFQTYMAREYLDYAQAAADRSDWYEASHFAEKGLKFTKGIDVEPDNVKDRSLPDDVVPIMAQARDSLIGLLTIENKNNYPKETARAQFFFDCWMERQKRPQESDMSYCRESFYTIVDQLYSSKFSPLPKTQTVAVVAAPATKSEPVQKITTRKKIYFKSGSFVLDSKARDDIGELVAPLRPIAKYEITVNGYADGVGNEAENMKLSRKRAQIVKKRLLDYGLDPEYITIFAFGKSSHDGAAAKAKNNKSDPTGRAVEVVIEY